MAVYNPSGSGNIHYDVPLTNISVAWQNEGLVGDVLFPPVPVGKQSNKYYIYNGREGWYPSFDDARAPGTEANEIPGLQVSLDTYYAQEHALQIAVTDEERENADNPFTPDADGAELLASRIALGREFRIFTIATTTANYDPTLTKTLTGSAGGGFGPQWDLANSTPIKDIRTAQRLIHKLSFLEGTSIVIPYRVMSCLEDSADLIARIQYVERGVLTPDLVASLLGVSNVTVPGFGYATNNPGQTLAISYLWDDQVVLAYNPPRPGMKVPAYGYEFVWSFGGVPQIVDRWREERRASDVIRNRRRYDLKLIGVNGSGQSLCGFFFNDTLSAGFVG
jgi:hypothetical protein